MKAEPFEGFTFKVNGVAIYQLGNFGTASKKLWEYQALPLASWNDGAFRNNPKISSKGRNKLWLQSNPIF